MSSLQETIEKLRSSTNSTASAASTPPAGIRAAAYSSAINEDADDTDRYIRNETYTWYDEYKDTNYSTIDPSTKSIRMNPSQISLTQEENSQIFPFEMNRYWEGIDLMQMSLRIHYRNKNKDEGFSVPINVEYTAPPSVSHGSWTSM